MARPTAYNRQNSFRLYSAEFPDQPHNGQYLDTEFDAVKLSLDETQTNLALIQDSDGAVARGSIGRAQLDSSITLGIAPPDLWETATDYDADVSVVFKDLVLYLCLVDHTSGVFATDLAAGYWQELADFSATAAIEDGSIVTAKLADGAVTTDKLGSNVVTTVKILNSAVTTDKIADDNVTAAKLDPAVGYFTTGDVKITLKAAADAGWVMFDDGTIGSAASGATTRANADTEDLFTLLWTNVSDSYAAVSGGRGASAAADWAADKTIALPKVLGRALAVAGAGSGLTSRALGLTTGAETHTLTKAEAPSGLITLNDPGHTHTVSGALGAAASGSGSAPGSGGTQTSSSNTTGITLTDNGSDDAHNNMQPTSFFNIMVKL